MNISNKFKFFKIFITSFITSFFFLPIATYLTWNRISWYYIKIILTELYFSLRLIYYPIIAIGYLPAEFQSITKSNIYFFITISFLLILNIALFIMSLILLLKRDTKKRLILYIFSNFLWLFISSNIYINLKI